MTTPLIFPMKCIMEWNNNKLTDHNRSELSVDVERIETPKRMANGQLRKYVVADKRTFSVSWKDVPHDQQYTVDGFWGGRQIENFYSSNTGSITLKLNYGDGTSATFLVVISSFSKNINKRGLYEFWDVDVELEEI